MATLSYTQHFKVDLGNEVHEFGSLTVPISITATKVYSTKQLVADNYTVEELWADGDGGMDKAEWQWLVFISDANVILQLRNDAAANAERVAFEVTANIPLILHNGEFQSDDDNVDILTLANPLTTLESTDAICVKRDVADTIGDANCTLYLFGV